MSKLKIYNGKTWVDLVTDGKDGKDAKIDTEKVAKKIEKKVSEQADSKYNELSSTLTRHVASKSYALRDLTDTQDATDGQVMKKQSDGGWAPADESGSGSGSIISVDGSEVSDPDFVSTGVIDFVANGSDVTGNINADAVGTDELDLDNIDTGDFTNDAGFITSSSLASFGTDNQIPFTNTAGDDFDYSANLTFDGTDLTTTGLEVTGNDSILASGHGVVEAFAGAAEHGIRFVTDRGTNYGSLYWDYNTGKSFLTTGMLGVLDIESDVTITDSLTVDSVSTFDGDMAVGTDTLFVDVSTGRVGIGTDSPSKKLDISDAKNNATIRLTSETDDTSWALNDEYGALEFYSSDASFGGPGVVGKITAEVSGDPATTSSEFGNLVGLGFYTYVPNGTLTKRMFLNEEGNLGIGTSTPTERLSVVDEETTSGSSNSNIYLEGRTPETIYNVKRTNADDSGAAFNVVNIKQTNDTTTQNQYNLGMWGKFNQGGTPSTNYFYLAGPDGSFNSSGIWKADWDGSNGFLGVNLNDGTGRDKPDDYANLTVGGNLIVADDYNSAPIPGAGGAYIEGDVEIDGVLTLGAFALPTTDGSANQVLKTDGSGTVAWEDDATGSGGSGIWAIASNLVSNTGTNSDVTADDFVFGSTQLADTGNTDHDHRMFFDKSNGAFRAGSVTGNQWDDANIGTYSVAFGLNTTASGLASAAFGFITEASDSYSAAFGYNTTASGNRSVAFGDSTIASGGYSTAFGRDTTASGEYSVAFGGSTTASGYWSLASGYGSEASALYSTAFGFASTASGYFSTSFGSSTTASGDYSTAFGENIEALGNYAFAVALDGNQSGTQVTANNAAFMGGNVGIGTASPATLLDVNGAITYKTAESPTSNAGNLGATHTFDFNTQTSFRGTLDADVTITVSNLSDGQRGSISLYYDGTAQRTITWSGIDVWLGGSAPTAPDTAGEPLVVTVWNDGSNIIASGEIAS